MGLIATYVNSSTLKVTEDKTAEFVQNRKVKANCDKDGYVYSSVSSSSYDSSDNTTTVNLNDSVLTSNLSEVWFGIVPPPGPNSAFPGVVDFGTFNNG